MPPKTKTDEHRREPLGKISRELWILSVNECALTGCSNRFVGENGSFNGEVAASDAVFREYTKDAAVRYGATLNRLSAAIGSPGTPSWTGEEWSAEVCLVYGMADRLSRLTDAARNLLAFLVEKQHLLGLAEVSRRTRRDQYTVRWTVEELDRHGHAYIDPERGRGEPHRPVRLLTPSHFNGWPFFEDLQTCLSYDAGVIRRIFAGLDFSVVD